MNSTTASGEGARGQHELMQPVSFDPSLSWTHAVYIALAGFLGYLARSGYKWFQVWLGRKKPIAEIHETEARTTKTFAEARRIHTEADSELNAIIERLHLRIDQMQIGIDELRDERNELKMRVDMQQIELELADFQKKKMKALLDFHAIKYSELDEPK